MTRTTISYADLDLAGDSHELYEHALKQVSDQLGAVHAAGSTHGREPVVELSPVDKNIVVGRFAEASPQDVHDAVAAARAQSRVWARRPWRERLDILETAADLLSARVHELAAVLTLEIGKTRLEAIGEAEEAAEFFRYYCARWRAASGFDRPMGSTSPDELTRSVLRPYGVWAVIAPFNYPLALAAGPAAAALVAGNTVVVKASEHGYLVASMLREIVLSAGVPADALQVLLGDGETVGAELVGAGVDGITFTGSHPVGMEILRRTAAGPWPKPVLCEMGGKNAAIVTEQADLAVAASGIVRSAFGYGGQKCSACSRVLVARSVRDDLLSEIVAGAQRLRVGDPAERQTDFGPLIDERAARRFTRAVETAEAAGRVHTGGTRLTDGALARGVFLEPTVVEVPREHRLWRDELFLPLLAVSPFDDLDEAIRETNATPYGLTAGLYSGDQAEIDTFLTSVHAGVLYVDRPSGATTGAWPGQQPFGGWNGSGGSGRSGGGEYYLLSYLREQSHTIQLQQGA